METTKVGAPGEPHGENSGNHTGEHARARAKNVGLLERVLVGLGGAALARAGLRRGPRSWLGLAMTGTGAMLAYRGLSGRCAVYERLGIDTTGEGLARGVTAERSITVNKPPDEVYQLWRRLENLPRFMKHLESVSVLDDTHSHWVAREGPLTLAWDTEIIEDAPGTRIAWRSLPGGDLDTEGMVSFAAAPGDQGTEVRLRMQLVPPGGRLSMMLAPLLRRLTRVQLGQELHRMKQILEVGEIATNHPETREVYP